MSESAVKTTEAGGPRPTAQQPQYHDGPVETCGDIRLHRRCFTYLTEEGRVCGSDYNVVFTVDRSARVIWPYFKDFNRWQGSHHSYSKVLGEAYSSEVGDLGAERFEITATPGGPPAPHPYQILKVIPERLIVVFQPIPEGGLNGGVSRGFHVFMLNEHDGHTLITCLMNHASRTVGLSEEQALEPWRKMAADGHRKWRDFFIPALKRLVYEGK
jgi:hypothetical protein